MAVQSTGYIPTSDDELDPQYVATAFVEQYYLLLRKSPEMVYKFYNDQSSLGRPGPDGEMTTVMTMQVINDMIMSSDYKGCLFETINVDAQGSLMGGVIVVVDGYFIGKDNLKKSSFYQTFFLAKQPKGYFVLNDILHFGEVIEETLLTSNDTKENALNVPLTQDQVTPEIPAQPEEVIDSGEKVSDEDCGKKASDGETGENLSDIKTSKNASDDESSKKASDTGKTGKNLSDDKTSQNASDDESSKKASDIGSGKDASDIDSSNNKGSDIKETVAQVPNSSVNGSESESTLPHVASDEKQEPKKFSYASMVAKESKVTFPTHNTGYKIVRVAANADQQSIAAATLRDPCTIANSAKKEVSSGSGAAENNNVHADAKSIYIANLPLNITKHGLVDALKIFGRVRPDGIQIRAYEDGFCFGFVEFESAAAASKAVEAHNVTVGGHQAYMLYKKSGSRSGNSTGGNVGSRIGSFKGRENEENRGNGSNQDNNQADPKSPQGSSGQNGDSSQKNKSSVGRFKSKQNSQRRDDKGKTGDASQKKNKKKQ